MIDLELSWRQAGAAATGLIVASVALRAAKKPRLTAIAMFTQESGLILALFALWQLAGSLAGVSPDGALPGRAGSGTSSASCTCPARPSMQHVFLPHPLVIQFFNLYYDSPALPGAGRELDLAVRPAPGPLQAAADDAGRADRGLPAGPAACRSRRRGCCRNRAWSTPRMLYHQSVYSSVAGFDPDQLSAMPSVHVGWAILVAVAVITTLRSRWRWLALLYPVMTTLAVIVTANHFWLDGIVAPRLILVLALAGPDSARRTARRRGFRAARAGTAPPSGTARVPPEVLDQDGGRRASLRRPPV